MRCVERKCPCYHNSDIFEHCGLFHKYIIHKDTACDIEDFHRLKVKYNDQIDNLINRRNQLDLVFDLVSKQ